MANVPAIRAQFNVAAKPPSLTASQRRLLADPFSLGGELVAWEAPGDAEWCRRERPRIQAVKGELERSLMAPTPSHVEWCVRKLFALPSKNASEMDKALQTDNFMDVCGHFPDDLWTWGTTELLKTSTFRPSPSEMVKLLEPKYAERQRMLDRCKSMLSGPQPKPAEPTEKPIPTRLGRLQHIRSTYERMGRTIDVERIDREIAAEQGATVRQDRTTESDTKIPVSAGPYQPADTPTNRRLAELAAAKREGRPAPEYRDVAEAG
jgi:hypothetical protein